MSTDISQLTQRACCALIKHVVSFRLYAPPASRHTQLFFHRPPFSTHGLYLTVQLPQRWRGSARCGGTRVCSGPACVSACFVRTVKGRFLLSTSAWPKISSRSFSNCTTCTSHLSRRGHDMAYAVAPNFIRARLVHDVVVLYFSSHRSHDIAYVVAPKSLG